MKTTILRTSEFSIEEIGARAKEVWEKGGLVAFPTETVYGLGGNGLNSEAAKKIYAAKGRPSDNPLILHIGSRDQIPDLVRSVPETGEKLMDAFFPGPLTLIFEKADRVPFETSGGLSTIAIRMPSHPTAHAVLSTAGMPIAAPSANLSGRPSTTSAAHVIDDMDGRIDLIIDDGEVPIGVESTIVDLTGPVPMLLRPGFITVEDLTAVIGPVLVDPAITKEAIVSHTAAVERPKAPGMKYRHYAPKAPLTVVYGPEEMVLEALKKKAGEHTGILTVDEHVHCFAAGKVVSLGTAKDRDGIARHLFSALRKFDELDVTEIYSEDYSGAGIGVAVMNRLLKAAGGNYIHAKELLK